MIYICQQCDFLFERSDPQTHCPFCQRTCVRPATQEEEERFETLLEQRGNAARRLARQPTP